jgi:tetratricopeptide (TPR) repeat protein
VTDLWSISEWKEAAKYTARVANPIAWANRGHAYAYNHENGSDLREAVEWYHLCLQEGVNVLGPLSAALYALFLIEKNEHVVIDAIDYARMAIQLESDTPRVKEWLATLQIALEARFRLCHSVEDLDDAITIGRDFIESIPYDHPYKSWHTSTLAGELSLRYEYGRRDEDAEQSIDYAKRALECCSADGPTKPEAEDILASSLFIRGIYTSSLKDLNDAITNQETAVNLTEDTNLRKSSYLAQLSKYYTFRGQLTASNDDHTTAVQYGREALAKASNDTTRAEGKSTIARALSELASETKSPEVMDDGIRLLREAREMARQSPEPRAYDDDLAWALVLRCKLFDVDRTWLNEAIDITETTGTGEGENEIT